MTNNNQNNFYNYKSLVTFNNGSVKVFIDLSEKGKIIDCSIECPEAGNFSSKLIGASVDQILEIVSKFEIQDFETRSSLYLAFNNIVNDIRGKAPCLGNKKIICRCFGVDQESILKQLNSSPASSVLDLTDELSAGAGCMSCVKDMQDVIIDFKKNHVVEFNADKELFTEIEARFRTFKSKNKVDITIALNGIDGDKIYFSSSDLSKGTRYLKAFDIYIREVFNRKFEFIIR